ncbi:hypothetical protein C1646_754067 [Rhizophagus diaphanus]|nr:hypothetical protein C1646_754067 [Rhizophagus diaphanus] [Rhizophagus sp. MUCL 43196]
MFYAPCQFLKDAIKILQIKGRELKNHTKTISFRLEFQTFRFGYTLERFQLQVYIHLPHEEAVSKEYQKINEEITQLISISIININTENQIDQSEEVDIEDEATL